MPYKLDKKWEETAKMSTKSLKMLREEGVKRKKGEKISGKRPENFRFTKLPSFLSVLGKKIRWKNPAMLFGMAG